MSATENKFILSNGMEVPCIGFGTYNAKGGDNLKMIKDAIEVGYRYFDTASLYGTERALGQAIKESGIPRDQFIIASKVWIDEMGYENTKAALHRSLSRLQTDYLDFYLIHWPKPKEADENWKELDLENWRAMEELVQAWSPLARGAMQDNPIVQAFAQKYQKSAAQICLRFLYQKGIMPLVKASSKERMLQNMDIFDFALEKEDVQLMECMPQNTWQGEHPDFSIPKAVSNFNQ